MTRTFTLSFTDREDADRSAEALQAAILAMSISHGCEASAKGDAFTVFTAMPDLQGPHLTNTALACARNANRINRKNREYTYSEVDYHGFFVAEYQRLQAVKRG